MLTLASIQRLLSQLASAPLSKRAEIPGLHPDRAPTIVAGVVILVETMRAFGLERIEVSEHDILYGVAIDGCIGFGLRITPYSQSGVITCTHLDSRVSRGATDGSKMAHRTPKISRRLHSNYQ